MQKQHIPPTTLSPETYFSPEENIFVIRGISSPEDVRGRYYKVTEWIKGLIKEIIEAKAYDYIADRLPDFQFDLNNFNPSSAKFLYDTFLDLKRFPQAILPVTAEPYYDEDDIDMKEAGLDIAFLAKMENTHITKSDSYI